MQLVDEEALEYVPEYTYVGQLISFRDNAGKEIKKENWNGLEQVQESRIYTDRQILKIRDKDVQKSGVFLVLSYGAQTWSLTEKEKKMRQTCEWKMERRILPVVRVTE